MTTLPIRINKHWEGDVEDVLPPMYKTIGCFSRECLQQLLRVCVSVSKEEVKRRLLLHINKRASQAERRRWISSSKVKPGDFKQLWPKSPTQVKSLGATSTSRRKTYADGMDQGQQGENNSSLLGSKRRRAQSTVVSGLIRNSSKRKKANNTRSTRAMKDSDDLSESPVISEVEEDSSDSETSHELGESVESDEGDEQARDRLRETQDRNYEDPQVDANIVAEEGEVVNSGEDCCAKGHEPRRWSPLRIFSGTTSLVELKEVLQPKTSKVPPRQIHNDEKQSRKSPDRPPARYSSCFERSIPPRNDNHIPEPKTLDSLGIDPQARDDSQTRPFRNPPSTEQNRHKPTSSEHQPTAPGPPCDQAMGDITSEIAPLPERSSLDRSALIKGLLDLMDQGKLGPAPVHPSSHQNEPEASEHEKLTSKTRAETRIQEAAATSNPQTAQSPVHCVPKVAPPSGALDSSCTHQLTPVSLVSDQRSPLNADTSTRGNIESESLGGGQNLSALQLSKDEEAKATFAIKTTSSISHCLTPFPPTAQSNTTSTCEPQIGAPPSRNSRVPNQSSKSLRTLQPETAHVTDIIRLSPCTSKAEPCPHSGISKINPIEITKDTEKDRLPERPMSISSADGPGGQALDGVAHATQASSLAERAKSRSREVVTGEDIMEEMTRQDSFRDRVVKTLSLKLKDLETSEVTLKEAKLNARHLHIISDSSEEYNDKVRKLQELARAIKTYHNTLDALGLVDQTIRCQVLAKKHGVEAERRQLEMEMVKSGQTAAKSDLDRAEAQCRKARKCLRDVCQPLIGLKGSYILWLSPGSRIYDLMQTCQEVLGDTVERHWGEVRNLSK